MSDLKNPTDERAKTLHERHAEIFGDKSRHNSGDNKGESEGEGGRSSGGGMTLDMAQKANKGDQEPVTKVEPAAIKAPEFKPSPANQDDQQKDEPQKNEAEKAVPKSAQLNPELKNLNAIQPPPDIRAWRAHLAEKEAKAKAAEAQPAQTEVQAQAQSQSESEVDKPRPRTMR